MDNKKCYLNHSFSDISGTSRRDNSVDSSKFKESKYSAPRNGAFKHRKRRRYTKFSKCNLCEFEATKRWVLLHKSIEHEIPGNKKKKSHSNCKVNIESREIKNANIQMKETTIDERRNEEHQNSIVGCDSGDQTNKNERKLTSSNCCWNIETTDNQRDNQGYSDYQFHCTECDSQTKNEKHMKTKQYKCNFCDFQSTENSLLLHIKNNHSEAYNNNYYYIGQDNSIRRNVTDYSKGHYDQNNVIDKSSDRTNKNKIDIEENPSKFKMSIDLTLDSDEESKGMLRNNIENISISETSLPIVEIENVSNSESTTSHKQADYYYCSHCHCKTPNPASLKQHNDEIKSFFCQRCSYRAQSKMMLAKHIKKKHKINTWLYCQICPYKTMNEFCFIRHFRSEHTGRELYACKFCRYITKFKKQLVTHLNQDHIKGYNGLQCQLCNYVTRKVGNYEEHMITQHNKLQLLECEDCTYKTKFKPSLVQHMRDKHGKNKIGCLTPSTNLERYILVDSEEETDSECEILDLNYTQTNVGFLTEVVYLEENTLNCEARDAKTSSATISLDPEEKLGSFYEMSGPSRSTSSNINMKFLAEGDNPQMDMEEILPQFKIGPMSVNFGEKKLLDSNTIDMMATNNKLIKRKDFEEIISSNENVGNSRNTEFYTENRNGCENKYNFVNTSYKNEKSSASRNKYTNPMEKGKILVEDFHFAYNNDLCSNERETENTEIPEIISESADASKATVLNVFNSGERESIDCLSEKTLSKFTVGIDPEDLESVEVDISWM